MAPNETNARKKLKRNIRNVGLLKFNVSIKMKSLCSNVQRAWNLWLLCILASIVQVFNFSLKIWWVDFKQNQKDLKFRKVLEFINFQVLILDPTWKND